MHKLPTVGAYLFVRNGKGLLYANGIGEIGDGGVGF